MIRKINGVLALASAFVILLHITISAVETAQMLYMQPPVPMRILLIGTIGSHAVVSLAANISAGAGKIRYPEVLRQTILQRLTGVLMIILAVLHVLFIFLVNKGVLDDIPHYIYVDIVCIVLAAVAMLHLAISFPKAFVALGIVTSEESVIRLEKFSCIFFTVAGLLAVIVFARDIVI